MKAVVTQVLQDGHVIGTNIFIKIEEPRDEEDLQLFLGGVMEKEIIFVSSLTPEHPMEITTEMIN